MKTSNNKNVKLTLLKPLAEAFSEVSNVRECPRYSDWDHVLSGVSRVLGDAKTGREFVQYRQCLNGEESSISVHKFFDALSSKRRTTLVQEVSVRLCSEVNQQTPQRVNPLFDHPELENIGVYATDGHADGASAHENKIQNKKRCINNIFSLNLKTNSLTHLSTCTPVTGAKKEHEMKTLKNLNSKAMRMNEPKGRKVIHAYDPAIIDYQQWYKWKHSKGVYIITVEKSNSALRPTAEPPWDENDLVNNGVLNDQWVFSSSTPTPIRRVTYQDPISGKTYKFLTNEMNLSPGLIAFIYRSRWNIEKVFDETKNKLGEAKAWGKSKASKEQQACFITMAYNLLILLEQRIEKCSGIIDFKTMIKRDNRKMKEIDFIVESDKAINPLLLSIDFATQRSLQFIRWLRSQLIKSTSWDHAMQLLLPLQLQYLK